MGRGQGGMGARLRSALDTADQEDVLGKAYDLKVIRRMGPYLAWVKWSLAKALCGTAMRTAANMAMPAVAGMAVDRFIKTGNLHGLTTIVVVYVLLALLMWAGQYIETLFLSYSGQGIIYRMRTQMFDHLIGLSMSFFDHNKAGKVMSHVQNDVDQLQTLLTQDIVSLLADTVTLAGIAIVMMTMNLRLALIALSVVPVLAIALTIWRARARIAFVRVRQAIALVNDNLQESISGVRVVQGMARERVNLGQFDSVNRANMEANVAAAKLQAFMMPTIQILTDIGFALVLVFGGLQVLHGQTTAGVVIAFLLYIQRFFAPVQDLTMMYTDLQRAMASGARVLELIDVEPEIKDLPGAVDMPPIKGQIDFRDVRFAYDAGTDVLSNLDLHISPGETVAIVGPTGAGKSSLASLVTRFYDVQRGAVEVDGADVKSVKQRSLRRQICIVPQEPFLFSGTIEDNIRFGRPEATHDEILQAAKTAGVHDAIMALDRGYDTQVGERGSGLSGGQRQFVCLARTILAEPAVLILDEATASIDTNSERIIQDSLARISKGRTCIIVAHRLSTVTNAQRIIVIDRGRIVEAGTHADLMRKEGAYARMFKTLGQPSLDAGVA